MDDRLFGADSTRTVQGNQPFLGGPTSLAAPAYVHKVTKYSDLVIATQPALFRLSARAVTV